MNKAQRRTLEAIFSQPVPATLEWRRIESLFVALGAQIIEGDGSRVRFLLNGVIATFHSPTLQEKRRYTKFVTHEHFWRALE